MQKKKMLKRQQRPEALNLRLLDLMERPLGIERPFLLGAGRSCTVLVPARLRTYAAQQKCGGGPQ
jgi:hypothetical protein